MARLEDLTRGATVKGILPDQLVTVVDVRWFGSSVVELFYKDAAGRTGAELIYRDREPQLEIASNGRPWSFDGEGELFRLVSEAYRIRLAYLFDPLLAVHTSLVDPLPHQITAVYGEMLTRQPLRYLLADDPGSGKTIMTGLFLKELQVRGDLKRCLICCPGNLGEQWQDELFRRFHLDFDLLTHDMIESARTGNVFAERNQIIVRLDQLSRNEDLQAKLAATDWDVVVCDEAHKMSASFFSGEVKPTKRYKLGQLLGRVTRHFLLLTATPHNGKEEDFQLFMALLDADRFEGRFRDGVHVVDTSDLMRRMVKEQLVKFDGRPLFPERFAYTVTFTLSAQEARLYREVTHYVTEEMDRADRLMAEGEGRRGNTVGFALTILQRRLASSPEAIYQSLRRRRERLEKRLREERILKRGAEAAVDTTEGLGLEAPDSAPEDVDDLPAEELEQVEEEVVDRASAARTIRELELEIERLRKLEALALAVRRSGTDRKWEELSGLLQGKGDAPAIAELFDAQGHRRKLILFTEHRDTLNYLADRIRTLIGRPEAIVTIDGSLGREERRKRQEAFAQDKEVQILVATDAAGEGINLQRAHLMINYDLPWNPNRIEQRFGRIHRIGQTEVCHLWNLVAPETREGDVYHTVLHKLEQERQALGSQVFDVLGKCFSELSLRELLIQAVRYGDRPDVRAKLDQVLNQAFDREHIQRLVSERALANDSLTMTRLAQIREDMERAEARRLQPHFVSSFFRAAFESLGGTLHEREPRRYEITHVPTLVRGRDRQIGVGDPVLPRYERVTFEKERISLPGLPPAEFICPGHPLLDATTDLVLERSRDLLKRGTVLVDPQNRSEAVRALLYLEHSIQDARTDRGGARRLVSRQIHFVERSANGEICDAGYAPYLDYRPMRDDERALVAPLLEGAWLTRDLEAEALAFAVEHIVPAHLNEYKGRNDERIAKVRAAVKDRLTKEIVYWDNRAQVLKEQEDAGRPMARLNSALARQRADDLQARLQQRMLELDQESHLSALPPVVMGGALVVPEALLAQLREPTPSAETVAPLADRSRIDHLAVAAVLAAERRIGRVPREMPHENPGYDIESRDPASGRLVFIEVKGKVAEGTTVTVSKTQVLTALNKPDDFILALVPVDGDVAGEPRYIRHPFRREPDFHVVSVNYNLDEILSMSEEPK